MPEQYARTVPDKPAAEVTIDEPLVRHLVSSQASRIPQAATLPLVRAAEGWDCAVWRLGDAHAVRLPRRAAAAPLIQHEQASLSLLAPAVEASGIRIPVPIVHGTPDSRYPWAWSVVPWIAGDRGLDVPRGERTGWAPTLAAALAALHVPAPPSHPDNPVRGRPLVSRATVFEERLRALVSAAVIDPDDADVLAGAWSEGVAVRPWPGTPVWIHGDLHPGNLVASGSALTGIIDFGDVTAGDPAYDLAVAWLAFDRDGREGFIAATGTRYDDATWARARAWSAAVAVLLLAHSDDEPDYARLGRGALAELTYRS
nr:phosphotransferase [Microbacterium sp. MF43]